VRRTEIINAIDRIVSAIEQTQIAPGVRILTIGSERTKPENLTRAVRAIHGFGVLAANFGEAERFILEALNLGTLLDSEEWAVLLFDEKIDHARMIGRALLYATEFLPRLKEIIEPEYRDKVVAQDAAIPKVLQGKTLLTVIAIEERDQFSGPQRLIEVLQSITLFYEALAILEDKSADDLIVLTCDSGSDKSFDFLGAAKLMEQLRELILSLWDRVVFFRERKAAERIELVAKSLPVIEQIARLRETGALMPEKAEIVTRKVLDGVEKFLRNGATIPEIRNASQYNSRSLLAPQTKLLMDAPEEASGEVEPKNPDAKPSAYDEGLSEKERAVLRRLLAKLKDRDSGSEESIPGDSAEKQD
jgi:hypothetical protein